MSANNEPTYQNQDNLASLISTLNFPVDTNIDCKDDECKVPYEKDQTNLKYENKDGIYSYCEDFVRYQTKKFLPYFKNLKRLSLNLNSRNIIRTFKRSKDPGFKA